MFLEEENGRSNGVGGAGDDDVLGRGIRGEELETISDDDFDFW